jgi:hypothetical protein
MGDGAPRMNGLGDRLIIRLLDIIERLAFSVLPRGPLRKRLLERVDQALKQMRRDRCGGLDEPD